MAKNKWLVILIIVGFWGTKALADSLDPFWQRKISRGIEGYILKPVQDYVDLNRNAEEYNRLVEGVQDLPEWLDKPRDLEEVRAKISDYQKNLLQAINTLNQEKIPRLGVFNTTWNGVLVKEIDQKEVQNIFKLINTSLEGYQAAAQTGRAEKICLACIERLKHVLKIIPFFTPEFKATFAYARGREAIYQGNRLAAGLIEHFGVFNTVNIWWDSPDPASTIRFVAQREVRGDSAAHPSYHFVLGPPQEGLEAAWEALGISPGAAGAGSSVPKAVGYYSLRSFGDQEFRKEISWALLSFETEGGAEEFWAGGGTEVSIKRHGDSEEFEYLVLEKLSWPGQGEVFYAYGGRFGPYILLVQPRKGAWIGRSTEEHEIITYLANRLIH